MSNLFYEQLEEQSEEPDNLKKFELALQEISRWCHRYRYDCKDCPFVEHEMGGIRYCGLVHSYGLPNNLQLRRINRLFKKLRGDN